MNSNHLCSLYQNCITYRFLALQQKPKAWWSETGITWGPYCLIEVNTTWTILWNQFIYQHYDGLNLKSLLNLNFLRFKFSMDFITVRYIPNLALLLNPFEILLLFFNIWYFLLAYNFCEMCHWKLCIVMNRWCFSSWAKDLKFQQ